MRPLRQLERFGLGEPRIGLGAVDGRDGWQEALQSGHGALSTSAALFDALAGFAPRAAHRVFDAHFEALAGPGERLPPELKEGDLLVRRAFGEGALGSTSRIASTRALPLANLPEGAWLRERAREGLWVEVDDGSGTLGYRLLSGDGQRLPVDAMLVRGRGGSFAPPAADAEADGARQGLSEALTGPHASPCDLDSPSERVRDFALDSSRVGTAQRAALQRVAACVVASQAQPHPIREMDLVGHTDTSGGAAYNQRLGLQRAQAARTELIREIDRLRPGLSTGLTLRTSSEGESDQIPGSAADNRRVEISVPVRVVGIAVHTSDTDSFEVASNLGAAGLEHFVCVKNTGDMVLQAELSPTLAGSGRRITWEATGTAITSPAVGTDGRTAKIGTTRDGRFPLRIKLDGRQVREARAWVVWSEFSTTTRAASTAASAVRTNDGTSGPGMVVRGGVDHTFTILPRTIISDTDRPALDGAAAAAVPGAALRHVVSGNTLGGGATRRWDVSRQIRCKVLNPHLYPVADLDVVGGHLWNNQPVASDIPENYPAVDTIGNDDSVVTDENNDPYSNAGQVTSTDTPVSPMRHRTGSDGDTFEVRMQFREFLRLNLGTRWFRASDFSQWRLHARVRRTGGAWVDNGSTLALDNAGF